MIGYRGLPGPRGESKLSRFPPLLPCHGTQCVSESSVYFLRTPGSESGPTSCHGRRGHFASFVSPTVVPTVGAL